MPETAQTLTKLILNNKIVQMRKYIKQARIHSINKLCREIKKLKSSKLSDSQKEKKLKKAEKLVQQVVLMKKIKPDVVTKFAFLNKQSMTEILNNINESLEKKVLIRLSNHKIIKEKLHQFRETYSYSEELLHLLFETLGEKYKNKKSKNSVLNNNIKQMTFITPDENVKKSFEKKKMDFLIKSKTDADIECNNNLDGEMLNNSEKKENKQLTTFTTNSSKLPIKDKKFDRKVNNYNNSVSNEPTENMLKKENSVFISKTIEKNKPIKNKVHNEEINNSDDPVLNEDISNKFLKDDSIDVKLNSKIADPFFMTKDNNEYLSIAMKETVCNNDREYHVEKNKRNTNKSKIKLDEEIINIKRFRKQGESRISNAKHFISTTNEKLNELPVHPSWEAKRKQQASIQNIQFKGKKIKFDE